VSDGAAPVGEPLVVGLGSPDRGDDAVGPAVARAIGALALPGVTVIAHEDPTALIHAWVGRDLVVVVDAVVSGGAAGTLHIRESGADSPALPESAWADTGRGGTHAFGLATAMDRLPRRVVLVGIEAASFDHGVGLSPRVAAAVDDAVEAVRGALEAATTRDGR
jgi:hydrogenase maturation protease